LEHEFKNTDVRIIHISTDCIFDGMVGSYVESDAPTERNLYGMSKAIGEVSNDKDITFRTSIIGPEVSNVGTGLFDWFLKKSGKRVNGWDNAFWSGVTTLELAKCINRWIDDPIFYGRYHLTNNKKISKYELLEMINKTFEANKIIIQCKGPKSSDKSLIDTRGNPIFSVNEYQQQLIELKKFMEI
jgi:dTDP-4-dehydrorhamnose reductase